MKLRQVFGACPKALEMAPSESFGALSEQISPALWDIALSHRHDFQMNYTVLFGPDMPARVHQTLHNVPRVDRAVRCIVEAVLEVEQS